ncbi:hypothetical protein V8E54_012450 [Elaphomyces granulatus]
MIFFLSANKSSMHFLKAISILACAIPLSCATNFNNEGADCQVQDLSGNITPLAASQSVVIDGGWAFVWSNKTPEGYSCDGFAYQWPESYGDVYWYYDDEYAAYLYNATRGLIPQNGTQRCNIP